MSLSYQCDVCDKFVPIHTFISENIHNEKEISVYSVCHKTMRKSMLSMHELAHGRIKYQPVYYEINKFLCKPFKYLPQRYQSTRDEKTIVYYIIVERNTFRHVIDSRMRRETDRYCLLPIDLIRNFRKNAAEKSRENVNLKLNLKRAQTLFQDKSKKVIALYGEL